MKLYRIGDFDPKITAVKARRLCAYGIPYQGAKTAYLKTIVPPLAASLNTRPAYFEPFCGSCVVGSSVDSAQKTFSDASRYLIALYTHVQQGGAVFAEFPEAGYADVKNNPEAYPAWVVGLVGYGCSFGTKFFGGYAKFTDPCGPRNPLRSFAASVLQMVSLNASTRFECAEYGALNPQNATVYCDPPYAETTGYKFGSFSFSSFDSWAARLTKENNCAVFLSERRTFPGWRVVAAQSVERRATTLNAATPQTEYLMLKEVP